MPMAKAPKKEPQPDDLVRQEAGNYLSGDERFEVRQSDANWYLVDREQANEFGQELMHGPFPSMKAAKAAMPGARDVKPLLRSTKRPKTPPKKEPPKPEPTWIDKLPTADATEVRKLIRALQRDGVEDAEPLVRKDRQGNVPAVASALLKRDLERVIADLPEKDQQVARKVIDRVGEVLTAGERSADPLPGWSLVELGPGREPTRRRLRLNG